MAIADSGYVAPEHVQSSSGNSKADVYAFGVLLLEIVTGRKPFDKYTLLSTLPLFHFNFPISYCLSCGITLSIFLSTRAPGEQSLVRWASLRLHDSASLAHMVDPAVRNTIPSKSLSRFADVVSLCIQVLLHKHLM